MVKIEGYTIYCTRKNDVLLQFDFTDEEGNPYQFGEGEKAVFAVARHFNGGSIIQKDISTGECAISGTELNIEAGAYLYDITIITDNEVITVIPYQRFMVIDEVY